MLNSQSMQDNIDRIKQKMIGRGGIVVQSFSVGDVVRLRIPGVNRTQLGRKFLPCKVLEIVRDNLYSGCTSCMLSNADRDGRRF